MFIKKYDYIEIVEELEDKKRQIDILECKLLKLQDEINSLRSEKDDEHLENYENHRKLLQIERRVKKPFASMKDALDLKNDIKNVFSKT